MASGKKMYNYDAIVIEFSLLTSTIAIFYGFETWCKVWPFKVKVERKEKLACKSANKSDKKFAKLLRSLFKNSMDRLPFKRGHCIADFRPLWAVYLKLNKFLTAKLYFCGPINTYFNLLLHLSFLISYCTFLLSK